MTESSATDKNYLIICIYSYSNIYMVFFTSCRGLSQALLSWHLTGLAVALLSFLGMVAHKASSLQSAIEVQSGGETSERKIFPPNSEFHL